MKDLIDLKIQNFKNLKKALIIFLFFLIQFSAKAQVADSIKYDYNSNVEIRTSPNIKTYLDDDFYLYDNERVVEAETWWQKVFYWIGNIIAKLFYLIDKGGKPLSYTFYFIIFAIFIFILTKLLGIKYQTLFLRSKNITSPEFEFSDEDIHGINFEKVIKEAEDSGNFRKAIRYLYINYLKTLTENELIDWHANKTNKDYDKEMKDTKYYSSHKHLSRIYEYIWYGEFYIDALQYKKYKNNFKQVFKTF